MGAESSIAHSTDPRAEVEAPIVAALNTIMLRAVIGFAVVAAATSVPILVHLPAGVHGAVHLLLPGGWLVYAVVTGLLLILRGTPVTGDPWQRAAEVDPGLARFARVVYLLMLLGWAASVAAMLAHHHLGSDAALMWTIGVDVPVMFAVWGLAAYAWDRWCAHALARAEDESADRLRRYWSGLAGAR